MKHKGKNIKLITDASYIAEKTINQIVQHIKDGKVFALAYQEGHDKGALVFNPKTLFAAHTDGVTKIQYNCFENFIDAVRLTLIAYPVFISCEKIIEDQKPKIILLP